MDKNTDTKTSAVSRRDFTAGSVAAATLVATAGNAAAADVVETDVTIKTPDGTADAAYFHPATGKHPAVIDLDRYFRPAPLLPRHGPPAGGRGLYRAGAQSLLPHRQIAGGGGRQHLRFQRSGQPRQDRGLDRPDQRPRRD